MKILSIKKLKPEVYEIEFENGVKDKFMEDVLIKYNLHKKEIDDNLFDEIIKENNYYFVLFETIKFIEKKLRSESEVREFLYNKNVDIEKIVTKLNSLNLINDFIFAKSFVNDKFIISKFGKNKIIALLNEHNIRKEYIDEAVLQIDNDISEERIKKIIDLYFKKYKKDSYFKIRNKVYNYLIDKGYDKDDILEALNEMSVDNSFAVKEKYNKLYKKFSKKHSGSELDKKIISSLLNLGFNYEDIKKIANY